MRFASPASPTIPSAAPNNATEADCSSPVEGSSGAGGVTGVGTASLSVADSEVSLDAEQVEDIGAVEADPFFSAGLLVSVDATFGASSDFFVSAFSSFLDSAFASLFPVAAGVSEVTAELDRSTFGAGASLSVSRSWSCGSSILRHLSRLRLSACCFLACVSRRTSFLCSYCRSSDSKECCP